MTDTYDQQIEALLAEDYDSFKELVDSHTTRRLDNHRDAWTYTGVCPTSLFATFPGVEFSCASIIEHMEPTTQKLRALRDLVLEDSRVRLPDFDEEPDRTHFTRAELEEFARRQRVARTLP